MEKNNDRKAPKIDHSAKKKSKIEKIQDFYKEHKWALVVTFAVLAIVLFVGALLITTTLLKVNRPDQVEIPNVSGAEGAERMKKDEALKLLNSLGFNDIEIEEEYSDEIEEGYIISQKPEYQAIRSNVTEKITLVVSKGQKIVTLPKKIVGRNLEDVKKELDELELKYELIEENSETVEAGIVLKVDPEEGEEITAATEVSLTVSIGSAFKDVTVPSVLNDTEEVATQKLKSAGLIVSVSYEENSSKSDGIVTSQSITSGKVVKEGDTIDIVVNKQPTESTVTVNVNLKSLMNYTEPSPTVTNTVDESGNTVPTTITPEIERATVVIEVGEDTILSETYPLTKTDISKSWKASGVKEVRVKVGGVTQFKQKVDFNVGNQTLDVK